MLKRPASCASFTWKSPAVPVSCIAHSACIETPVAPIGWPLALSPPDGLTGSLPPICVTPSLMHARACAFRREPHRFVFDQLGDGEAVVGLDQRKIAEREAGVAERALPGQRAALELEDVALRHRQEVLHMRRGAERHRLARGRSAVSASASTIAAAPSDTSEQSVRLSGPAT